MSPSNRRTFLKGAAGAAAVLAIEPELMAAPARFAAPMTVGIVGCGRQARLILAELSKFEDISVGAICDVDAGRLRAAKRRAADATSYDSHVKMLAEAKIDAVIVSSPTHTHKTIALAALAAGKHVYCEGPLATTLEDCRSIVKAANASGNIFQTGMHGRSNPIYKLALTFKKAGVLRKDIGFRAQASSKVSWRSARGGAHDWKLDPAVSMGLIGELGTHQFDVIHWYTGSYPVAVRSSGAVLAYDDGRKEPDTSACELRFANGSTLNWTGTLGNSYEGTYEQILGTTGTMKLSWTHGWLFKEADAPTLGFEVYANRQKFHNDEGITLIANATKLAAQGKLQDGVGLPNAPVFYALESFFKSISEKAPIVCTAHEGLRAAVVAIQARKSMLSGDEVAITPDLFEVDGK